MKYFLPYLFLFAFPFLSFAQFSDPQAIIENNIYRPDQISTYDLDGDGDLDLLISDNDGMGWFENLDGSGGFGDRNFIFSRRDPFYVMDVDEDGDLDILSSLFWLSPINGWTNKIIWFENENGSFGTDEILIDNIDSPSSISSSDIDQDGDLDLVVSSSTGDKISWFENDTGVYTTEHILAQDIYFARTFVLTDFNGDGSTDVLGVSRDVGLYWIKNENGLGSFSDTIMINLVDDITSILTGDVDGDGDQDVIYSVYNQDKIAWQENLDGLGNFGSEQAWTLNDVRSVLDHDLDGDGDLDVFALGEKKVGWFENEDGQGSFGEFKLISNIVDGLTATCGDINGDGHIDVFTCSYDENMIVWHRNEDGLGNFSERIQISNLLVDPRSVYASDIDGDGDLDALLVSEIGKVQWSEYNNGSFQNSISLIDSSEFIRVVATADLNSDGSQDIITGGSGNGGKISWYENINGLGDFSSSSKVLPGVNYTVISIFLIDLDNDGDIDLLSTGQDNKLRWYKNEDGQGNFSEPETISNQVSDPSEVFATDIDGDGDIDVLSVSKEDELLAWYENEDGLGDFSDAKIVSSKIEGSSSVHAADLDGDGDIDIVAPIRYEDKVVWFRNEDGLGSFSDTIHFPDYIAAVNEAFAVDVDADGDTDVVFSNYDGTPIGWYENTDGNGTFQMITPPIGDNSAQDMIVADIGNDGDFDVLYTTYYQNLLWLENTISTNVQSREFITSWKTDNTGKSCDTCIEIPTIGLGYNYDVDWDNDGVYDEVGITGTIQHDYLMPGVYTVKIRGDFPRIYFFDNELKSEDSDAQKFTKILQWGDVKWESMESAFQGCEFLELDAVDNPDLSKVENISSMFERASLVNADLSEWDVSNVTEMKSTFNNAVSFNQDISAWSTDKVMSMENMFSGATDFNQDLNGWDVSQVENFNGMFRDCISFNKELSAWDMSSATTLQSMFQRAEKFNFNIDGWDVSKVWNMAMMFQDAKSFNSGLNNWDVSSVLSMMSTFSGASNFNGAIGNWDVAQVENMHKLFQDATTFNQDISAWDVSTVTNMSFIFGGALSFNEDISGWDVSGVQNMNDMFINSTFNQNISSWDVSAVEYMESMFAENSVFNQDLSSWDVSSVTTMSKMFRGSSLFNSDIGSWNVSSVKNFFEMFSRAESFDYSLGAWNISAINEQGNGYKNLKFMLDFSGMSVSSYDATLNGWADNAATPDTVDLGAVNLRFCDTLGRALLIDKGWSIIGDSQDVSGDCVISSIKDIDLSGDLLLSPNPCRIGRFLEIRHASSEIHSLSIFTTKGKSIVSFDQVENDKIFLDTSELLPGFYLIRVLLSSGKAVTKKLVVMK